MRALAILTLLAIAATASAQGGAGAKTKTPATGQVKQDTKTSGTKAPATKPPATKPPATKAVANAQATKASPPRTKTTAPATKTVAPTGTKAGQGGRPALAVSPETAPHVRIPTIMREVFEYDAGARRDPFYSLLATPELRPTITDLRLVGILYDETGQRPIAVMREVGTNTQYRVTTGMTLGRMRVSSIRRRAVIFTIEEFGLNRQDTLVLGDTTKARIR